MPTNDAKMDHFEDVEQMFVNMAFAWCAGHHHGYGLERATSAGT
jgi:hypothetical protein